MGYLYNISEGQDNIGSYIEINCPQHPIFEDAHLEIMGRSLEDDENDFHSKEDEIEAWGNYLKKFKGELNLLICIYGGYRIYTVLSDHYEKLKQLSIDPSYFFSPGMSNINEIEIYLNRIESEYSDQEKLTLMGYYFKTNFKCSDLDINIKINRFNQKLNEYLIERKIKSCCFITAWNPGKSLSEEENNKLNKLLAEDLKCYSYFEGIGIPDATSSYQGEESFLVFGIDENKAVALMEKYSQNAIVFVRLDDVPILLYNNNFLE